MCELVTGLHAPALGATSQRHSVVDMDDSATIITQGLSCITQVPLQWSRLLLFGTWASTPRDGHTTCTTNVATRPQVSFHGTRRRNGSGMICRAHCGAVRYWHFDRLSVQGHKLCDLFLLRPDRCCLTRYANAMRCCR